MSRTLLPPLVPEPAGDSHDGPGVRSSGRFPGGTSRTTEACLSEPPKAIYRRTGKLLLSFTDMTGTTYEDFLDLSYVPGDDDLVCTFYIEPAADMDMEAAGSQVASESSNGTWAELQVGGDITDLGATTFELGDDGRIKVAYPSSVFEAANMPQVLSCIAGNIMEMKAVDRLGSNICVQVGGGVHGHPDGTRAGARALRQAIDTTMEGVDLETYSRDHPELATTLEKWGTETPR